MHNTDGNAALVVPDEFEKADPLAIVPRRQEVVPYALAGALMGCSRMTVARDPNLEHVKGANGRYLGVTVRSLLKSRVVQNDEQRAIAFYEQGGDPLSLVRETGIGLMLAERVWKTFVRLREDERVMAARASRERASCEGCHRTKRQAQAGRAVLEARGALATAEKCAVCNEPIPPP